jgi:hypothetical protein
MRCQYDTGSLRTPNPDTDDPETVARKRALKSCGRLWETLAKSPCMADRTEPAIPQAHAATGAA